MATTISNAKPSYGKAADAISIIGTGFLDAGAKSVILCRKHGDTPWTVVDPTRVAYVSGTELTLTLSAVEFDDGGLWDIGVADFGETAPDAFLSQALFFYVAGAFSPDDVIKGAPDAIYIDGVFMGHAHGSLDLEHAVETSDIEVNESLTPVRTVKTGETFSLAVPLAEVTLEHFRDVWGVSAEITDLGNGRRRLTFGGDVDVIEKPVMVILPAGSGKKWAVTFYRCAIVAPGTLSWNRDDQVDLALNITILADTSRAIGDRVGRVEEYEVT